MDFVNIKQKNFMDGIEIYKAEDGLTKVDVKFENETVWLSQQQMSYLFKQTKQNVILAGREKNKCRNIKRSKSRIRQTIDLLNKCTNNY
jgi:hypothetical protein